MTADRSISTRPVGSPSTRPSFHQLKKRMVSPSVIGTRLPRTNVCRALLADLWENGTDSPSNARRHRPFLRAAVRQTAGLTPARIPARCPGMPLHQSPGRMGHGKALATFPFGKRRAALEAHGGGQNGSSLAAIPASILDSRLRQRPVQHTPYVRWIAITDPICGQIPRTLHQQINQIPDLVVLKTSSTLPLYVVKGL